MQQPTRDDVFAFFADPGNKQADAHRKQFLQQQDDWQDEVPAAEREDYQDTFMRVYGIHVDWKEGIFSLLEAISTQLGDAVFTVVFDDDSDIATVNLAGNQHRFHHHQMGTDGFDNEWERLEHLLSQHDYGLRLQIGNGISDTMSFLLLPSDVWVQMEQEHGAESVSAHFVVYGSTYYVPELDAEMIAGHQKTAKAEERDLFDVWHTRIFIWLVLPVLAAFALWVLWGVLSGPKG